MPPYLTWKALLISFQKILLHIAAAFALRSLEAAKSLEQLVERGRMVPELKNKSICEIFVYNFILSPS